MFIIPGQDHSMTVKKGELITFYEIRNHHPFVNLYPNQYHTKDHVFELRKYYKQYNHLFFVYEEEDLIGIPRNILEEIIRCYLANFYEKIFELNFFDRSLKRNNKRNLAKVIFPRLSFFDKCVYEIEPTALVLPGGSLETVFEKYFENWLVKSNFKLSGMSPLEAVKHKDKAIKVAELLQHYESISIVTLKPEYDCSWFWERLGLDKPQINSQNMGGGT